MQEKKAPSSFDFDHAAQYHRQWHLNRRSLSADFDPRASLDCEAAWKSNDSFGDPNVVVAVADDGCRIDLPVFGETDKFASWAYLEEGKLRSKGQSFTNKEAVFIPGQYHGTSVCSLIAAEAFEDHPIGVCPNCRLLPVRWGFGDNRYRVNEDDFLRILDFVSDKVDIMINTWSKKPNLIFRPSTIKLIAELANRGGRRGKGILFVWASGNSNCPISLRSNFDIPYQGGLRRTGEMSIWRPIRSANSFRNDLAGLNNVLLVGAISSLAQRSHYSAYGPGLSCCAPSNNSHAYGLQQVRGLGLVTCYDDAKVTTNFKGTSGAAALVAGVAALVVSANMNLDASEVASILLKSASKDLSLEGYPPSSPCTFDDRPDWDVSPVQPYDTGNFASNGWSPWFGYGKVDALQAVLAAAA